MRIPHRFLQTLAVAILALSAINACGNEASQNAPVPGVIALSDAFTGEFALTDQHGAPISDEDLKGKVMLVYFGFTNCPDVCPGDVGVMSAALNALGEEAAQIAPIFISVDPARDTPAALKSYFGFDDRIIALTGDESASKTARAGFNVYAAIEELPDSALGYTVNHLRMFFVTNRDGQPVLAIPGAMATPESLADLLRRNI